MAHVEIKETKPTPTRENLVGPKSERATSRIVCTKPLPPSKPTIERRIEVPKAAKRAPPLPPSVPHPKKQPTKYAPASSSSSSSSSSTSSSSSSSSSSLPLLSSFGAFGTCGMSEVGRPDTKEKPSTERKKKANVASGDLSMFLSGYDPEANEEGEEDDEKKKETEKEEKKKRTPYSSYFAKKSKHFWSHSISPPKLGQKDVPVGKPNCLAGLTFVCTGVLESLERDGASDLIRSYGGRVTTSVSGNTDYLVSGLEAGVSKLNKARAKGAEIIDEDQLFELIRTRDPPKSKS